MKIIFIFAIVFFLYKLYSAHLHQLERSTTLRAQRQSLIIHEQTKRAIADAIHAVKK